MTRRHAIMGIPVNKEGMAPLLEQIEAWVTHRDAARIVLSANAAKVYAARTDVELRTGLLAADWVLPDGMGVVWASAGVLSERLAGCDVAEALLARCAERGWRPYLLGGRPEVIAQAVTVLAARHPHLRLAGHHHGYLTQEMEMGVAESIGKSAPDILLIGMGSPRQERFLDRWAQTMGAPCNVAVGGTFDVLAGRVKRAPVAVQKHGLEWLWRSLLQPQRVLSKRSLRTLLFAVMSVIDRLKNSS